MRFEYGPALFVPAADRREPAQVIGFPGRQHRVGVFRVDMECDEERFDVGRRRPVFRMEHEPAVHDEPDLFPAVSVEFFPVQEPVDLRQELTRGDTLHIVAYIEMPLEFVREQSVLHGTFIPAEPACHSRR